MEAGSVPIECPIVVQANQWKDYLVSNSKASSLIDAFHSFVNWATANACSKSSLLQLIVGGIFGTDRQVNSSRRSIQHEALRMNAH
eukprot:2339350-Amphidinium_carterae.1